MTATTPEQRVSSLLQTAHRLESELAQFEWYKQLYEQRHPDEKLPLSIQEQDYDLRTPFSGTLDSLYLASLMLIQSKGMPDYLQLFHQRLGKPFDAWKAACNFDHDEYFSPGPYNVFLRELRNLLAPFNVLSTSIAQYERQAGALYLERILNNTAALVQWSGVKVERETDVSRAVRDMLYLLFPRARNAPPAKFIGALKSYVPDILIPELCVAIEYKYVDSDEKLKTAIEGIAVDVPAYTGDAGYDTFYAVFYLTSHFCTAEHFYVAWSEFSFPANWKSIFVVGS